MVTPSLTLFVCLLAQDPGAPPATIAAPPFAGSTAQPSSRRSRVAAQAIPAAEDPQAPAFHAQPVDDQTVDPVPPDQLTAGPPPVNVAPANVAQPPTPRRATGNVPVAQPNSVRQPAVASIPGIATPAEANANLPPATRLEPATENHPAGSPGAVLIDAMSIDAVLEATGKPMRLVEVLGRARDPRVSLSAIDAYWGVSLAWVAAHWQWSDHDCVARMEAMSPVAADKTQQSAREAKFRARLAATLADWKQSEVELTEAQQRLASLLRLAPSEPLPLAGDLPHLGAYKTRFETLYASLPAPERSLLIHRTLPLRETELRMRADAVDAARQSLEAAEIGFHEGTVTLETVFCCLDDQKSERQAFLTVVHRYNVDIAEYALATPVPAADEHVLAARLIKLRRDDGTRLEPSDSAQPSAASGGIASPIAVVPSGEATFDQPATHMRAIEPPVDPRPPVFDGDAPPIQRGEE